MYDVGSMLNLGDRKPDIVPRQLSLALQISFLNPKACLVYGVSAFSRTSIFKPQIKVADGYIKVVYF